MIFNPFISVLKFIQLLVSNRINIHKESINKTISLNDSKYLIFRHISIKGKNKGNSTGVLVLKFKFHHSSLEKDCRNSFFQIPIFVGLPGFQSKLWTFDKENGVFQGVYQWKSPEHIHGYLNSFAVKFVKKKAVENTVDYKIYENTNLEEFLEKNI